MLSTLFEGLGLKRLEPLIPLSVSAETAAAALVLEERLFALIETHGLEASDEHGDKR
jgi:hypothetical protein